MAAKKCTFCRKKLDDKGRCQNKNCVDYKRTQMLEAADKEKEEEQSNGGGN